MKKLIISENIIKENLNDDLDLSDRNSVISWMEDNAPEHLYDDNGNLDWDYTDSNGDDLYSLMYEYMNKYKSLQYETEIPIYRMLRLNSIDELNLQNVGVYWSFKPEGVGTYGAHGISSGENTFMLTANVDVDDINWGAGFYSFLAHGTAQFECFMTKGSSCEITHINEKRLKEPIRGIC